MNEEEAHKLAEILGGYTWQSGGGILLVIVRREDNRLVVFSGDVVCEYETEEAFDAGRADKTIMLC